MIAPSLTVSAHEPYSPALRDKISDLLRTQAAGVGYHVLSPSQLRSLAANDSPEAPILSLYLRLDAARRVREAWRTAFTSLRDETLKPIEDRRKRQTIGDEFDRVAQALAEELPVLGRGAAFFVCLSRNLWQQTAVAVPLPDAAYLGPRPYLRPLVRTRDEQDRFVLAVVSREFGRFFVSQIGQVEEVLQIKVENVRKVSPEHTPRDHNDGTIAESIRHEGRIFAHAADLALSRFEGRSLLLSGNGMLRAEVVRELPKALQLRVGEPFSVELHARPAEIAAAAEPAQRIIEAREETATVQHLLDAGPSRSAWDVQPTLNALYERRVTTLVVDDAFRASGARCRNCGALWQAMRSNCGVCGKDAMEPVDDVAELAIEHALEERAALEMVRSPQARQLLARVGPMAAIVRW